MNVLVIGKFYIEGFARHIAETLERSGHDVRRFEPGHRLGRNRGPGGRLDKARQVIFSATDGLPQVRSRRLLPLWRIATAEQLDVVIVCHDFLWPKEVEILKRRTGAQIAMWFPDALANLGRSFFMNSSYDALFFKDPYIVHGLGDVLKAPVYYLPECFNPATHWLPEECLSDDAVFGADIATAGNIHSWRVACLENLSNHDVKLWGPPKPFWMPSESLRDMHQGRAVYNHDKVRALRGAKIVVNNLHVSEVWGVNARTFETAGAGAFQLVDWRPGLSQLFEDGRELITFRGMEDLKKKVHYWLPRGAERRLIAEAGMRRAHQDHTYALRLALLLDSLAGSERGYPLPSIRYLS